MKMMRTLQLAVVVTAAALTLAACTPNTPTPSTSGPGTSGPGTSGASAAPVTLQYAIWVDTQQPAYQACADAFHAQNPNITVEVTQTAWGQYWQNLTTQITAGTAPDVFADSVAYYPTFIANNQIVDIQPLVDRDKVDLTQYRSGLDLWAKGSARYGLPKDWDAVALVYNTAMLTAAGVDPASLGSLTWNPTDGGTFEKLIAKLSVDANGVHGDQPGFDANNVKTYGIILDLAAGAAGQTSWGNLAVSTGFSFTDKNPWGTKYNYSDPKFVSTITWVSGLQAKGFMPRYDLQTSLGSQAVLESGTAALGMAGSWMAGTYLSSTAQKFAFAPLPAGPAGVRTASNSISDAIWAGGKHQEEAWQWVKFMGSTACQDIVASYAVVFPAIGTSSDKALDAFKAKGLDVSAFLTMAAQPGAMWNLPLTDNAGDIAQTAQDALDTVWLGTAQPADAMKQLDDTVNAMFK